MWAFSHFKSIRLTSFVQVEGRISNIWYVRLFLYSVLYILLSTISQLRQNIWVFHHNIKHYIFTLKSKFLGTTSSSLTFFPFTGSALRWNFFPLFPESDFSGWNARSGRTGYIRFEWGCFGLHRGLLPGSPSNSFTFWRSTWPNYRKRASLCFSTIGVTSKVVVWSRCVLCQTGDRLLQRILSITPGALFNSFCYGPALYFVNISTVLTAVLRVLMSSYGRVCQSKSVVWTTPHLP